MKMRKPTSVQTRLPRRARSRAAKPLLQLASAKWEAVIRRHARTIADGRAMVCTPSLDERHGFKPRKEAKRADRAPIFNSEAAAAACAQELFGQFGAPRLTPYQCGRSRRPNGGHWHLS